MKLMSIWSRWITVFLALTLSVLLVAGPVLAQSGETRQSPAATQEIDFDAWNMYALETEQLLADPEVSSDLLEERRAEVVLQRERFLAAQDTNQTRIATLRAQIDALGPPPAEGASEAEEIAIRREDLNAQLTRLQAPSIAAVEAYSRADGLVREIDNILRDQQTRALLKISPSPVNPANWSGAIGALRDNLQTFVKELVDSWNNPDRREALKGNLPMVIGLFLFAGFMIVRGRRLIENWAAQLQANASSRGRDVWAFLASLGQIAVPTIGVIAISVAALYSGMMGPVGTVLARTLPGVGFAIFSAWWLAGKVFPAQEGVHAPLALDAASRRRGRFHTEVIGVAIALVALRNVIFPDTTLSEATASALAFPGIVVIAISLYFLGKLMGRHEPRLVTEEADGGENRVRYGRLARFLSKVTILVAVLAPVLGAVGYVTAAEALVVPAAISLGLTALLAILQEFVGDLWQLTTKSEEDGRDALVPVLIGFALVLLSLPVFAMIWGTRPSELAELFTRFREGFRIGESRISPSDFVLLAVVFAFGYLGTRLLQGVLRNTILPKTRIDQGGRNAIVSGIGYIGIFLAALIAITTAGIDLSGLAIVAGALSVGLGFGLQNIVSNFVSGIILLIERPISEGDWIEVGGVQGTVQTISVRSTRIQTFDRTDVIVPNSDFVSGVVTNWTRFNLTGRLIIPVGVAYGTDTRKVEKILQEIAEAQPLAVLNPPPVVSLMGFGADSIDFEIRLILRDVKFTLNVRSEINHEIARRFQEEGVEIPFGQRDIWLRNPEAFGGLVQAGPVGTDPEENPA
ncbi:MAG: DUF3772 domain-containing protein [Pseudorhodobacter sp.]